MPTYDLYGCRLSLIETKNQLETSLAIHFEARESTYQGGKYFRAGNRVAEHFEIKENLDSYDGEPLEQEFPGYPILLYVNRTLRPLELEKLITKMPDFFLLRRKNLDG